MLLFRERCSSTPDDESADAWLRHGDIKRHHRWRAEPDLSLRKKKCRMSEKKRRNSLKEDDGSAEEDP